MPKRTLPSKLVRGMRPEAVGVTLKQAHTLGLDQSYDDVATVDRNFAPMIAGPNEIVS